MNILVTGGTGGLGRAIVTSLAANTDNCVYFTYCKSDIDAKTIMSKHKNVVAFKCDQTKVEDLQKMTGAMKEWNLDVLINNAWTGSPEGIRFHKLTVEQLAGDFQNNVLPTIAITLAALEIFRKKKKGKIITVLTSSLIGVPPLGYGMYSSSKAYIAQMAKTWSREYIKLGITSNCVSPDFMLTNFTANTDSRVIEQLVAEHPLKQILLVEDTATVIESLVYAPQHVNGVNIPVNAGMNIL